MKKIILVFLCIILGIGFFVKYQFEDITKKPLIGDEKISIIVKSGDTFYGVLETLKSEDKIKNLLPIKYYISKNNLSTDIKPGEYQVDSDISIEELVAELSKGGESANSVSVTIIEGMNIEEMADKLDESGVISKDDFLNAAVSYKTPEYIKIDENRKYALEGYLYPDTYQFEKGSSGEEIIKVMINRFEDIVGEIEKDNNIKIDNLDEVITLASVIEKETNVAEERKVVSSVFHNRLEKGQMLQSCATVIYSIGNTFYDRGDLIVYNKDLEVDSPYNTYKNVGLPIGPIGSPRKESIEAALFPADTDYLYFVLTKEGKHFFTNDYNEFLRVKEEEGLQI